MLQVVTDIFCSRSLPCDPPRVAVDGRSVHHAVAEGRREERAGDELVAGELREDHG